MTRPNPAPILRPFTEDTGFYIDYDWWDQSGLDLKTYLLARLPISDDISLDAEASIVDVVDMKTGEVRQVDGFQYLLQSFIKSMPHDRIQQAALVDAVFYVLLGNANQPMSARELAERVQRSPDVILRTLTGREVFLGIRPLRSD
ncbi:MAG: hypothetical protein KC418_13195 [Anaerolineales bacterium]|nr:hypothetical protein [Anaerolineales bacterium]MCB8954447.1 hypothetical protein [Ardenticatenales bacterium]